MNNCHLYKYLYMTFVNIVDFVATMSKDAW